MYDSTYELYAPTELSVSGSSTITSPALTATVIIIALVIGIVAYLLTSWLMGRIFRKAGEESWKAFVPVYNSWTFLEVGGQKGYWALLAFVPVVGIASVVFMIIAAIEIGKNLGKSGAFALLFVFFDLIWMLILAFDGSTWNGNSRGATPPIPGQPIPPYGSAPGTIPPALVPGPTAPTASPAQPVAGTVPPPSAPTAMPATPQPQTPAGAPTDQPKVQ